MVWRTGRGIVEMMMKYAEFVSPPMKVLHQVLNFQEMSVPLFWESVVIAFICNVLPRGFLRDKPVPCVDRIGKGIDDD